MLRRSGWWIVPTKRCCCGSPGCVISIDNFNRANAATLGANWIDLDNAWTIDTNNALSVDPGVAVYDIIHRVPDASMHVYYTTIDEVVDSGRKYRVLCNVFDEDNYHYVEFERLGVNTSVLRLGKVTGGTDNMLKQDTIVGLTGTTRQVIATIAHNEFCGQVSNAVLSIVTLEPSIISNGFYAGIQSQAAGDRIDDFTFEEHSHTRPECANCICFCEDEYIPAVLNANITGTGRLASLNADIILDWDRLNGRWSGGPVTLCSLGQVWVLRFLCPTDPADGGTARLVVSTGCTSSDGFGTTARVPASYTCEPLEWVFGPYFVSIFDLACGCGSPFTEPGTYTIVITETP